MDEFIQAIEEILGRGLSADEESQARQAWEYNYTPEETARKFRFYAEA